MRCHNGSFGGAGGLNRLRLACDRVALTVFGGVRRRVALLGCVATSEEDLDRRLLLLEDPSDVSDGRLRFRWVLSAEGLLERLVDLLFRAGFFERLSLSELTVPPHRCQLCRHFVQGSKLRLVFQSKPDRVRGSIQAVNDGSLLELSDSHFVHFPLRLWFH